MKTKLNDTFLHIICRGKVDGVQKSDKRKGKALMLLNFARENYQKGGREFLLEKNSDMETFIELSSLRPDEIASYLHLLFEVLKEHPSDKDLKDLMVKVFDRNDLQRSLLYTEFQAFVKNLEDQVSAIKPRKISSDSEVPKTFSSPLHALKPMEGNLRAKRLSPQRQLEPSSEVEQVENDLQTRRLNPQHLKRSPKVSQIGNEPKSNKEFFGRLQTHLSSDNTSQDRRLSSSLQSRPPATSVLPEDIIASPQEHLQTDSQRSAYQSFWDRDFNPRLLFEQPETVTQTKAGFESPQPSLGLNRAGDHRLINRSFNSNRQSHSTEVTQIQAKPEPRQEPSRKDLPKLQAQSLRKEDLNPYQLFEPPATTTQLHAISEHQQESSQVDRAATQGFWNNDLNPFSQFEPPAIHTQPQVNSEHQQEPSRKDLPKPGAQSLRKKDHNPYQLKPGAQSLWKEDPNPYQLFEPPATTTQLHAISEHRQESSQVDRAATQGFWNNDLNPFSQFEPPAIHTQLQVNSEHLLEPSRRDSAKPQAQSLQKEDLNPYQLFESPATTTQPHANSEYEQELSQVDRAATQGFWNNDLNPFSQFEPPATTRHSQVNSEHLLEPSRRDSAKPQAQSLQKEDLNPYKLFESPATTTQPHANSEHQQELPRLDQTAAQGFWNSSLNPYQEKAETAIQPQENSELWQEQIRMRLPQLISESLWKREPFPYRRYEALISETKPKPDFSQKQPQWDFQVPRLADSNFSDSRIIPNSQPEQAQVPLTEIHFEPQQDQRRTSLKNLPNHTREVNSKKRQLEEPVKNLSTHSHHASDDSSKRQKSEIPNPTIRKSKIPDTPALDSFLDAFLGNIEASKDN